ASSFAAVAAKRPNHSVPVDLYLEGSDQHRGWFHSSLLVATATRGHSPYKACLTHGFVVDGAGKKMSKSEGNVVAPEDIIKQHGAEVLRLWVASSDYRDDVRLSKGILDTLAEGYRKIRNTLRYALSNLYDFDPAKDAVATLEPLDQWAVWKLDALLATVKKAYEAYELHAVYHAIIDFCAVELSSVYFDIQKDTLYTRKKTGVARRSAQTALYRIARELLIALAPITSFTSEEAWQHLPGDKAKSVFLTDFPLPSARVDAAVMADYEKLFEVRRGVLPLLEAARRDKRIGKSLEARVELVTEAGPWRELLTKYRDVLPELFIVSQVELSDTSADAQPVVTGVRGAVHAAHGHKCPRCWAFRPEVPAQPLCTRCTEATS
ncbi:MAG: class I tRNA ligase family protein, partial [Archangium sp.]|nr:class I tRNA ligase family protein [Archangium sp.]